MKDKNIFFGPLANEETNLFNRRMNWCPEDTVDEKYLEYLRPHSKVYFSRLRPMFSFEVKSLESLNQFSHVLFRDGLVFLLRFFQRYREPSKLKCKIYIHESFRWVVPKSWQENIELYQIVESTDPNTVSPKKQKPNELNLIIDLHDKTLDYRKLDGLSHYEAIRIIPFLNVLRGEDFLDYERSTQLHVIERAKNILGPSLSYQLSSWSELIGSDLKGASFLNLGERGAFYSDSALSHTLLSKGAHGIEYKKGGENLISLSPYHSFELLSFDLDGEYREVNEVLYHDLDFPTGPAFTSEPSLERGVEDYFKVHYYSTGLLDLCEYLIKKRR